MASPLATLPTTTSEHLPQPQPQPPDPASSPPTSATLLSCKVCREPIEGNHVNANNNRYHSSCFVCNQCLEPFPENVFFEADGQYFCDFDYTVLHGARCGRCGEIIRGKCITAMEMKWHPDHFTCETCGKGLAGTTFVKKNNRPYCKPCVEKLKSKERAQDLCHRCKKPVNENLNEVLIQMDNKKFHAHHFNCAICKQVLGADCKMFEGKLYCAADYERLTLRVCNACRRPIVGRAVTALAKQYHPEHFVCSKCERPFNSSLYWEFKGKPYCEAHYHELMGDVCGLCYESAVGRTVTAIGRKWCEQHFNCLACHGPLISANAKHGFIDWDLKPYCKKCFEELPTEVKRRVGKYQEINLKAAKAASKS
ncbi:LIM and senescent cell antigen-like-containing domain protein 2 [Geranomyces variabilis]|nr:LIM and senescent cell antigen-like-containing domain protein 2 [Geranomyces variabilis]